MRRDVILPGRDAIEAAADTVATDTLYSATSDWVLLENGVILWALALRSIASCRLASLAALSAVVLPANALAS